MVKFILVFKVCYVIAQFCAPPFQYNKTFDSFRDCAITGYKHAYEMIQTLPAEDVEKTQTFIKFYCIDAPVEPVKLKENTV